ncbi:Leucine-rich repeat-containing protein [Plasmodiophora brassicae]
MMDREIAKRLTEVPLSWQWPAGQLAFRLHLRFCRLQAIPDVDRLMLSVQPNDIAQADFSLNAIDRIDGALASFAMVRDLNLSKNLLTTLSLTALPNLTHLNLSHNVIDTVINVDLPRLVDLDLSGNRLTDDGFDTLARGAPRLETLDLTCNMVTTLDGIRTLSRLATLLASRNRISDLGPCASLPQLKVLVVAENQIGSLDTTRKALALLKPMQRVSLWGNPIAEDPFYKLTILDAAAPDLLDEQAIRPYVRAQLADLKNKELVDNLLVAITDEYRARIESEEALAQEYIDELRAAQVQAEQRYIDYRNEMNQELRETITFLQMARGKPSWLLTQEGLLEWKSKLDALQVERETAVQRTRAEATKQAVEARKKLVQSQTMTKKLYAISMTKPQIWRAMKARELELIQREEAAGLRTVTTTRGNGVQQDHPLPRPGADALHDAVRDVVGRARRTD